VEQMASSPPRHGGGRGFESRHNRHEVFTFHQGPCSRLGPTFWLPGYRADRSAMILCVTARGSCAGSRAWVRARGIVVVGGLGGWRCWWLGRGTLRLLWRAGGEAGEGFAAALAGFRREAGGGALVVVGLADVPRRPGCAGCGW
jgi:hypothetical protein